MRFFTRTLLSFFIFGVGQIAFASGACPWTQWGASQFRNFNYDQSKFVTLTADQVQQDLNCLSLVLYTQYSLRGSYPAAILPKVSKAIIEAEAMTNVELLDRIFTFHEGYVDTHLSYQVAGQSRRFKTKDPMQVTLSEDLEAEKLHVRSNFTYFKPGFPLPPSLSKGQSEFIEYIRQNDRPLVIDLRGNSGGDNVFAENLSNWLFTSDQPIPNSEVTQKKSPLQLIGHCNTVKVIFHDDVRSTEACNEAFEKIKDLAFSDLVKTNFTTAIQSYVGLRSTPFQSQVILIIDSGCASACETIVEKLSAHPKVKIIGAHTYGALHYSNAMSLILPNSGIWISIPTRREKLEKDAPEGYGYSPNLVIDHIELENILNL